MASASDILIVRGNTNEPNDVAPFTDAYIGGLIDASDVAGATAVIWENKAAILSEQVDVTEAGASHKFSDLFDHAQKMVTYWRTQAGTEPTTGTVRVKKIERA